MSNRRGVFTYENGHVAWITTPMGAGEPGHPRFGHGVRYVNVIDVGQSYVQDFVKRAVVQLCPDPRAAESTHLNYEKVGLTVAACDELGLPLSEDERKKTFVGMSGRKGRGVKVGDLIDRLERDALEEVRQRLSERNYEPDEQLDIAHKIAVGAVRYFLLKYTRNSVIAFDFKEALSFQGETGPYLQYAIARINSMFVKWEAAGFPTERPLAGVPEKRINELFSRADGETFWPLVYLVAQYPEVLTRSADALEPATLAKYAFTLAQQFASFYNAEENQVMKEADEARRALLIEICSVVRATLTAALSALGIDAPRRM